MTRRVAVFIWCFCSGLLLVNDRGMCSESLEHARIQRYQNESLGYSFGLPKGWAEISGERLAEAATSATEATGRKGEQWESAFEYVHGEKAVFRIPYIMISHHGVRSPLYAAIQKAQTSKEYRRSLESTLTFDKSGHAFKKETLAGLEIVMGLFLGKQGLVQVYVFGRNEKDLSVFTLVRNTFRFDPGAAWTSPKEKIGRGILNSLIEWAGLGLIGLLVVGVGWLKKRHASARANTIEGA